MSVALGWRASGKYQAPEERLKSSVVKLCGFIPIFSGPLMWGPLNCQFSGAEDVPSFRLPHGLYETAAQRQNHWIQNGIFFSYPSDFWVGVLLQLVQFTLRGNGDYTSLTTGMNSWCFGFCIKKKLASSQKSCSQRPVRTVTLATAGLKDGNLKKPDLLSVTFWKLHWPSSEGGLQIPLTVSELCS